MNDRFTHVDADLYDQLNHNELGILDGIVLFNVYEEVFENSRYLVLKKGEWVTKIQ